MGSGIRTVLFDLDETLCEYRQDSASILSRTFEIVGTDPFFTRADYREVAQSIGGTGSDVDRRERCFEQLARESGRDPAVGRHLAYVYDGLRDYTAVRFVSGARDVIAELGGRYRLGLVTNGGPDTQSPKIDALELRDRVDTVVLAGYQTAAKPAAEPFERAMADLDADPERTAHVGNSLASDVAGANEARIRSIWIPYDGDGHPDAVGPSDPTPDETLESIRELPAALGALQ